MCILNMGFATVTPLLLLKNIGDDILDGEFPSTCVQLCLPLHAIVIRRAGRHVRRNVAEGKNVTDVL